MFDNNTKTYRAIDVTGSYDWIFDNIQFDSIFLEFDDDVIVAWACEMINQSKDVDIEDLMQKADEVGWTQDEIEAELTDIDNDYAEEYEVVYTTIKEWIHDNAMKVQK